MSRAVTVDELRSRLDELLDVVEHGESVSIQRDGRRIAALEPANVQGGNRYPFRDIDFGSRPRALKTDVVELLREDRDSANACLGIPTRA